MRVLLAVFTCASCSPTLLRHWEYFLNQKADNYCVITTEDKHCAIPLSVTQRVSIGIDSYILGAHLPRRMVHTIQWCLNRDDWDTLILAEYDTVFFKPIPLEDRWNSCSAHLAGNYPEGAFYHNPWVFDRNAASLFVAHGSHRLPFIQDGSREASPDVFFGVVTKEAGIEVTSPWREFSRNSMDNHGDLDLARACYRDGYEVIHGIKTKEELEYITDGQSIS